MQATVRDAMSTDVVAAPLDMSVEEAERVLLACGAEAGGDERPPGVATGPLEIAAGSGDLTLVQALLDAGANPDGPWLDIPLHAATIEKHLPVVEALVAAGFRVVEESDA